MDPGLQTGATETRRAAVSTQLIRLGMHWADVELWLRAWQASSNMEADGDSPDFWDRGARWATDAWTAGDELPISET